MHEEVKQTKGRKPKRKSPAESKKEEPKKPVMPVVKKPEWPRMYVGPTIPGFAIQNRVYSDMPDSAKDKIKEIPELMNLFIEIREYSKANQMIREQNGYIYNAFLRALSLKK